MANKDIKIALVDDHAVILHGLHSLFSHIMDYRFETWGTNGLELLQKLESVEEVEYPHLVILDLTMPVMNGEETTKVLRLKYPKIKILILTLESNESTIARLFLGGVGGYMPKSSNPEQLTKAIDSMIEKGYYISEETSPILMKTIHGVIEDPKLSDKEIEFLKLVASPEELSYIDISKKMNVSPRTIDGYRDSLFNKYNIKSKTGLILFAIKNKIVDINS